MSSRYGTLLYPTLLFSLSFFSSLPPAVERELLVRVDADALVAADALDDEELDEVLHRLEERVDHHRGARVEHLARVREAPEVAAYRDAAVGALWKDEEGASKCSRRL